MATFKNDELLKTCPYNPEHRIAPSRFDIHLIKCAKKSTLVLETCPYYSTHRIPKELMAAHIVECPHARSDICKLVTREKTEWELLEEKKKSASGAAKLAEKMGAMGLDPDEKEEETQKPEVTDLGWSWDWNCPKTELYVTPGLEDEGKAKATTAYGANMIRYQFMTPAERRKFNETLVVKAKSRADRYSHKEAKDKEKEMKEKREQEKKEEQERLEKEKEEREQIKKEKEAKQKAKKERNKAAKRAAFFAKQAEDNENSQKSDDE